MLFIFQEPVPAPAPGFFQAASAPNVKNMRLFAASALQLCYYFSPPPPPTPKRNEKDVEKSLKSNV